MDGNRRYARSKHFEDIEGHKDGVKTLINLLNWSISLNIQELTSIIITHRITTAKEADKIIVLENGKVSEIGTHEELANKDGLYKTLWSIQGALEEEFVNTVVNEANKDKEVD